MIVDPEEMTARRRQPVESPAEPMPVSIAEQTRVMLARDRTDDPMALPRIWLARWRGDRHDLEQIAADAGRTIAEIRAGVDRALQAEGSSLAAAEERMRRHRARLGRGGVAPVLQQHDLRLVSR